jgi:hypothetical protein
VSQDSISFKKSKIKIPNAKKLEFGFSNIGI